jgi:predicted glycogen debranching enzyme
VGSIFAKTYSRRAFWVSTFLQSSLGGSSPRLILTVSRRARPADIESTLAEEANRRHFKAASPLESTLTRALDQFRVVRSNGLPSLIAGYPWFTDWSRDTLITLPACSIAGFPPEENKKILTMLVPERSHGLVPNRFSDLHSTPEYNTADATLWLFVAAHDYLQRTKDLQFLEDVLYPAALDILVTLS